MTTEVLATPQKMAVSVLMDVVTVEFICGDDYAAQILYEDICDRLRSNERLTITVRQRAALAQSAAPVAPEGK